MFHSLIIIQHYSARSIELAALGMYKQHYKDPKTDCISSSEKLQDLQFLCGKSQSRKYICRFASSLCVKASLVLEGHTITWSCYNTRSVRIVIQSLSEKVKYFQSTCEQGICICRYYSIALSGNLCKQRTIHKHFGCRVKTIPQRRTLP